MEELKELKIYYLTEEEFFNALLGYYNENYHSLYASYINETSQEFYENFLHSVSFSIYEYYKRNKVLYMDKDIFEERIFFDLIIKMPKYIVKYNVMKIFEDVNTKERYDDTSSMKTKTKEKGVSASGVLQSSASTPTGVSPEYTGTNIIIDKENNITEQGTEQSDVGISVDGYVDRYTNYQAKTNGVHDNNVDRDSEHTRKGGLLDVITLSNNLPSSFFDELLGDVAQHFVFIY